MLSFLSELFIKTVIRNLLPRENDRLNTELRQVFREFDWP